MSPLTSSTVAIPQEEATRPSRPWIGEWSTTEGLRFRIKRFVDVVGAIVGLLLLTPVALLIALLIRMDSRGPVLFRQVRRGYRGRPFRMHKFRTMTVDAEERLDELEDSNESSGGVLFKIREDPRVTRMGRILRRTSLDELPQLINVLVGEMSLVGPRPLPMRDSDRLLATHPKAYDRRLHVPPGITGPWQIGGRSEADIERMIQLDLDYVENWTLGRDLLTICKTFLVVFQRRGAY